MSIWENKLRSLWEFMNKGYFAKVLPLALELLEEGAGAYNKKQLRMIKQSFTAAVIEGNRQELFTRAIALMREEKEDYYSVFLEARIYWQMGRRIEGLFLLEEYFSLTTDGKILNIPADSIFYQMDSDTKERVLNLLGQLYRFIGMTKVAGDCYLKAFQLIEDKQLKESEYSNYLFSTHYDFMPKEEYFAIHRAYGELMKDIPQYRHTKGQTGKKIRIGYLSPDFKQHVVLLFIWAMVTQYDRDSFEVYCFSLNQEDKYSEHIKGQVDGWYNLATYSSEEGAEIIRQADIDILVELAGHSARNGLGILARKPAPVQICGIGYFATTGLKAVDYFLTDRFLIAPGEERYFTEKLLIMPNSHFCYMPLKEMPPLREAPCLKNGYITFGSFNNYSKVNDEVLRVWSEILQAVPNSKLLLKGSIFHEELGRALVLERFKALGISADRLDLRGFSADYLTEYYDMDIALDTFPYPGGGTTCDALYMGVPVISLGDGSHGGNFGLSLLKNVGLEECCTLSKEEYIQRAILLAGDRELINILHLNLRQMLKKSPIMDVKSYMADLEQGYREIWQAYLTS